MMVTVQELAQTLGLEQVTHIGSLQAEVKNGCVCDLLSWVMARGEEGMAWITVQTHLNVVAVACLHDFACVIIPESIEIPQATIEKADEEGIVLFSSSQTAYQLCCGMCALQVGR